jgi:hypothetical protein
MSVRPRRVKKDLYENYLKKARERTSTLRGSAWMLGD